MSRRPLSPAPAPSRSPAARLAAAAALLLAGALLAAGCARGDTHHEPGTGHEVATGSVPPATDVPGRGADGSDAGTTVEIAVRDGKVTPAPGRVEVAAGAPVTLRVTSDTDDELHVHGYDETAELRAGTPAELTFTADRTGLFDVETHGSGLVLTQLMVR